MSFNRLGGVSGYHRKCIVLVDAVNLMTPVSRTVVQVVDSEKVCRSVVFDSFCRLARECGRVWFHCWYRRDTENL